MDLNAHFCCVKHGFQQVDLSTNQGHPILNHSKSFHLKPLFTGVEVVSSDQLLVI